MKPLTEDQKNLLRMYWTVSGMGIDPNTLHPVQREAYYRGKAFYERNDWDG